MVVYQSKYILIILNFLIKIIILDFLYLSKTLQIDHLKPLYVPFGTDSMETIGLPPLSANELNDPNHKSLLDLWRTLFCKNFPQEVNFIVFEIFFNKSVFTTPLYLQI